MEIESALPAAPSTLASLPATVVLEVDSASNPPVDSGVCLGAKSPPISDEGSKNLAKVPTTQVTVPCSSKSSGS